MAVIPQFWTLSPDNFQQLSRLAGLWGASELGETAVFSGDDFPDSAVSREFGKNAPLVLRESLSEL